MRQFISLATLWFLLAGSDALLAAPQGYEGIDRHALAASRRAEQSVASLAKYLIRPAKNDRAKVRAIYRWLTDRIAYNAEGFFAGRLGDNSAASVLTNRQSVCAGYANLCAELCTEAGLEVVKVIGRAKGYGYVAGEAIAEKSHAWNAVKIDGQWCLVDATWGAGWIQNKKFVKQFQPYYFLTPPDQLIFTHLPEEQQWQLLAKPLSTKEFEALPQVPNQLFQMGVTSAVLRAQLQAPDFRELVKVYDHPDKGSTLWAAPLRRHLRAGSRYRFRIESAGYARMAIICGKKWFHLRRNGKVFEGEVTAPTGNFTLSGQLADKGQTTYWWILEYVGE